MSIKRHLNSLETRLNVIEEKLCETPDWDQALITRIKRKRLILRDRIKNLKKRRVA